MSTCQFNHNNITDSKNLFLTLFWVGFLLLKLPHLSKIRYSYPIDFKLDNDIG